MGAVLGFDWVQVGSVLRDWLHVELDEDLYWGLKIMESEMMRIDIEQREDDKADGKP